MDFLIVGSKVIICLMAIVIIILVLLQKPKEGGAGAAFGQSKDSFMNRSKNQTVEGRLHNYTKIAFAVFAVLSFALLIIQRFAA